MLKYWQSYFCNKIIFEHYDYYDFLNIILWCWIPFRYWAVTNIDYIHQRTSKRIGIMIFIIWFVSFLVCIAPLLGWKDPNWTERIRDKKCLISQDLYYQIFATASSFYLPLLVILILYWRIFQTARKRIRRRQACGGGASQHAAHNPAAGGIAGGLAAASGTGGIAAAVVTIIGRPLPTISETTTAFTTVSSNNSSPEKTSFANGVEADMITTTDCSMSYQPQQQHYPVKRKSRDTADSKRERKAAKTLAIITGAFVLCWLPFFIMAVVLPINANLFDKYMISICLWLGYFNSTLNPIIYTIFSPEFRHAFKKILCGRNYARRNKHFGIRHFQWWRQSDRLASDHPVAARLAASVAATAVVSGPRNVTFKCDWSEEKRSRHVVSPTSVENSSSSEFELNRRIVLEMQQL